MPALQTHLELPVAEPKRCQPSSHCSTFLSSATIICHVFINNHSFRQMSIQPGHSFACSDMMALTISDLKRYV